MKLTALKNILILFLLIGSFPLISQDFYEGGKKEKEKNERKKQRLEYKEKKLKDFEHYDISRTIYSLRAGSNFSNYGFYEAGISRVRPNFMEFWGGRVPWPNTLISASYLRRMDFSQSKLQGFNIDFEYNAFIIHFRGRWTTLYNESNQVSHYIAPGIGLCLNEFVTTTFGWRIPIGNQHTIMKTFNFGLCGNIPVVGKRL